MAIDAFVYARNYTALLTELKKKQKGLTNTFDANLIEYKKLGFYKNYNNKMKKCVNFGKHIFGFFSFYSFIQKSYFYLF